MEQSYILSLALLLLFVTNGALSQERVLIDVQADIPTGDASWEWDCDGYGNLSTDIECDEFEGGKVDIPPDHLNGERGFWTSCQLCQIKYHVKPGDVSFKARLYQRDFETEVSFDGVTWEFIEGNGWIVVDRDLGNGQTNAIQLNFNHFNSEMFNLLEKVVINGDFDSEPTTTTDDNYGSTSSETSESSEQTSFPTTTDGSEKPERVLIDVQADIPTGDASWEWDCDGYGDFSTDIECDEFEGGKVDIPPDHLNGERGFWTSCQLCQIKYHVKPGDVSFKARLYQRDFDTEVSFDGVTWEFIEGNGWIVLDRDLENGQTNVIIFHFNHFASDMFNLLEKVVINGDFEPTTATDSDANLYHNRTRKL